MAVAGGLYRGIGNSQTSVWQGRPDHESERCLGWPGGDHGRTADSDAVDKEYEGLDVSECGLGAYPEFTTTRAPS